MTLGPYYFVKHCGANKLSRIKSLKGAVTYLKKNPLQKKNAIELAQKFCLNEKRTARLIGMSLRLYKLAPSKAVLSLPANENLIRWAEVYETGVTVFNGDTRSFISWLNTRVRAFDHLAPMEVLESGIGGSSIVKDNLLQMEWSALLKAIAF